jgi:hypothetical protein
MTKRKDIYKNHFARKGAVGTVCISDLREKEFRNEKLSDEEMQAILNFDRFKLSELNNSKGDLDFNTRFSELQLLANRADYKEFLKEQYFFSELL